MASRTAVCTTIAKNYLPQARVLMSSVAQFHPDWDRYVILVDRVDGHFDPRKEPFEIISSEALPIPHSRWFHFKYTILELSTAVKPYVLEYIFRQCSAEKIIYLDPDIKLFGPLTGIEDDLDQANIVLTPHLTGSIDDEKHPTELDILRSGSYNLGFIAVSNSTECFRFLKWWQEKLYDHCVVDLPRGLFVDQRWVDLAPSLFEGVLIERGPSYNVAYWNLPHRHITLEGDRFLVNGKPLCFFHFSGYDPDRPDRLSRHQDRFRVADLSEAAQQLLWSYREDLHRNGYTECRTWPYAYGRFANDVPIPDLGRPIHHEMPGIFQQIEDPFSIEGFRAFVSAWNEPIVTEKGERSGISRLAYRIYRTREDVQSAMPDVFGGDHKRFLEWVLRSGKSEHGLGDIFLATTWDALRGERKQKHSSRTVLPARNALSRELANYGVAESVWLKSASPDSKDPLGAINELMDSGVAGLRLTRLARAIYESRPELQRFFPDPCGRDSVRFLVWLLTYGRKEHNLSEENLAPLREQWRVVLQLLPWWGPRLRYRTILGAMQASLYMRTMAPQAGLLRAKLWLAAHKRRMTMTSPPQRMAIAPAPPPEEQAGVNLVGYFRSETGVGQSARAALEAIQAVNLPVRLRSVEDNGPSRKHDDSAGDMSSDFPYSINIFHVNADQSSIVANDIGDKFTSGRHNIGYWAWELDEFPDRWIPSFAFYQEIWTPSSFCRDAIARKSPIPVLCVPHAVAVELPPAMGREHFGLPRDKFIFLCAFDMLSVIERKNPMGAVRAFAAAFGNNPNCMLVLKVNNAGHRPELLRDLKEAGRGGSIHLMEDVLSRSGTNALVGVCDSLVSLHRSEGFGFMMAEAMDLGKPVIATNYSGNTDFTMPDNSFLVGYRLVAVGPGSEPYDANCRWAEPDVEDAARQMRSVYENAALRDEVAGKGKRFVETFLHPDIVGATIRKRVESIQKWRRMAARNGTGDS